MLSHTHTLSDVAYTIMYRVKSTFTQHVCMLVCVLVCECVHMHACGCCCHGIVVCFHGVDSSVESKIATERELRCMCGRGLLGMVCFLNSFGCSVWVVRRFPGVICHVNSIAAVCLVCKALYYYNYYYYYYYYYYCNYYLFLLFVSIIVSVVHTSAEKYSNGSFIYLHTCVHFALYMYMYQWR